jgi:hypothetical protein
MKSAIFAAPLQRTTSGGFHSDAVREHRRVMRTGHHRVTDRLPGFGAAHRVVEEDEVLVPRDVDQHQQIVLRGEIEKPARRDVIDAEEIGAEFPDEREIGSGLFEGGEGLSIFSGSKRAIGDALEIKFLSAATKNFPSTVTRGRLANKSAMVVRRCPVLI